MRKPPFSPVLLLMFLLGGAAARDAVAGFMPPQAQILSDMVLANQHFTNEWPTPGCTECLSGNHPSSIWTRATYIEGSLSLYRLNHDTNIYNYAVQWGAFTNWALRGGDTDTSPDDLRQRQRNASADSARVSSVFPPLMLGAFISAPS
jgi:hypothetical protein